MMKTCIVCGQSALYFDLRLRGMACTRHASADVQIAAVRSLTAALIKAIAWEQLIEDQDSSEVALIIKQLRPLLKD